MSIVLIFFYFFNMCNVGPIIVSFITTEDYHERKSHAYRWKSEKALLVSTFDIVCWIPYGDYRAFRKFEVISLFIEHIR